MPGGNNSSGEKTYFEQQREMLVGEVAQNLEAVLQNINKLNRSLEGVIAVSAFFCFPLFFFFSWDEVVLFLFFLWRVRLEEWGVGMRVCWGRLLR